MPSLRYPNAAKLLHDVMSKSGLSNLAVAKAINKSTGAVSNYRKGFAKPDKETSRVIQTMAKFFFAVPEKQKSFIKNLEDAWKVAEEGPTGHALDDLALGRRKFVITSFDYPPFAGPGTELFFNLFASRLLDLAGIPDREVSTVANFKLADYSQSDVVYGILESVDRMLRMKLKFWRFPIRIGLGAICPERHRPHWKLIAQALSHPESTSALVDPGRPFVRIRPIVVPGEVGSIHCRQRLKLRDDQLLEVSKSDPKALASALMEAAKVATPASPIPVVCVDEFTAFRVLKELGKEGCSVFPMNGRRETLEYIEIRRELPQYYCSLATKRGDSEFKEFMQDALTQVLSTEIETTATLWFSLAVTLAEELLPVAADINRNVAEPVSPCFEAVQRWRYTWSWVIYSLHLDSRLIESLTSEALPWRSILLRARQLLQMHFAQRERSMITDLVNWLFASRRHDQREENSEVEFRRLERGVDLLCDVLDVRLSDFDRRPSNYIQEPGRLVENLIRALNGEQVGDAIEVIDFDPSDPDVVVQAIGMHALLGSLANMYDALPNGAGKNAVRRIRADMNDLPKSFSGTHGRIILANLDSARGVFIGGLCVTGLDGDKCQLRYLWVEPGYRGLRVGARLIDKAVEVAIRSGCQVAEVEVLSTLKKSIKLFIEKDFQFLKTDLTQHPPKTILERDISSRE